jgi:glycosyltransferase involved in cell wall biosynthesis
MGGEAGQRELRNDEKVTVSILIPNYQNGPDVIRAIRSAKQGGAEVVVYDDGSRNGDAEALARVEGITLIAAPDNFGQGWNNHCNAILQAFRASRGDIIMLLDGDDEFLPGKVDRIRGLFEANPDVGYIQHAQRLPDGRTFKVRAQPRNIPRFIRRFHCLGWIFGETSGLCFRREVFEQIAHILEYDYRNLAADPRLAQAACTVTQALFLSEVWGVYHYDPSKPYHRPEMQGKIEAERYACYNQFAGTALSAKQYKFRRFFSALIMKQMCKKLIYAIIHNRSYIGRGSDAARA